MYFKEYARLSDEEFSRLDIAELNLRCAAGLPGAENLDVSACLMRLDEWSERIRLATDNAFRNKSSDLNYHDWSDARFKMVCLAMMLQNHLGLKFNYDFNKDPYDGSDSRNHFIHATLMDGYPATCCVAPVLYVALGRRLGYPLKLVITREHIFCRWDDPHGERFNFEAASPGFYTHPDEYYYNWPKPIWMEAVWDGVFLHNLSPRREFAISLSNRGTCLTENLRPLEANECFWLACQFDKKDPFLKNRWKSATLLAKAMIAAGNEDCDELDLNESHLPTPVANWEVIMNASARRMLNRIVSNHRKKRQALLDQIFSCEFVTLG